jgi:hypothetical protein
VLVERSHIPENRRLEDMAREAAYGAARHLFPPRASVYPFPLAKDMPSYSRHDCKVSGEAPERTPWAYVADLPEVPLTDEERMAARLAELERRTGVAA